MVSSTVDELRRKLKAAEREVALEIDGRKLHLTNLDKVFWPQPGLRKADLIDYYIGVSRYLLPHLRNRPLVMVRYPDGIEGEHWFHKDAPEHTPEWVRTKGIEQESHGQARALRYIVCDDLATLVWLAQLAAIEIHTWSATADDPDRADRAVFDIDPQTDAFADAVEGARAVCDLLDELDLAYYLKTTGKRGIHVFAPLTPEREHREVREFVHDAVREIDRREPGLLALSYSKAKRKGRCFIDYAQNAFGKTNVAPYSLRGTVSATAATPFRREHLGRVAPGDYRLDNMLRRLAQTGDLWQGLPSPAKISVAQAHARLRSLAR